MNDVFKKIRDTKGTFNAMIGTIKDRNGMDFPDVQAGFRKGRGTREQIANFHWIVEKAREFQKTSISALLTMPKHLTVWITINGKF